MPRHALRILVYLAFLWKLVSYKDFVLKLVQVVKHNAPSGVLPSGNGENPALMEETHLKCPRTPSVDEWNHLTPRSQWVKPPQKLFFKILFIYFLGFQALFHCCLIIFQTCDMGFTETVRGDPVKFELSLNGRSEVFVMQVSNYLLRLSSGS